MKVISASAEETEQIAAGIAKKLANGDVVAFSGPMGAGKTSFTRGLVKGLGIDADVSSPTFALVHEYCGAARTLYHFDLYRISGYDDLESTGFFDYLGSDALLAIEWSENAREFLPENTVHVAITPLDETTREIIVKGGGRFEDSGD